tara:strand:+ start:940 stop:1053 length:114 start_codon:yes stop_codon:yes gene_type:complete
LNYKDYIEEETKVDYKCEMKKLGDVFKIVKNGKTNSS